MAVGHQDHGRVAMPVAAMLAGAVHQPLDLALGEVAPLHFIEQSKQQIGMRAALPPGRSGRSARARPVWQRKIGEPNRAPILQRAWPPVGGTFYFEILVTAPLPKTWPKMVLRIKGVALV